MKSTRRFTLTSWALAGAFSALAGIATTVSAHSDDNEGLRSGMVFTSSNEQSGNELLVYARGRSGTLTLHAHAATGGQGSGAGLGSQGAVTLSGDGRYVFVVNAQSNSISTFELRGHDLHLSSTVSSGGLHPISVTENDGIVYVVNDAGNGNVAGFRNVHGDLKAIAGSIRGLSVAGGAGPGQVGLSDDGEALVVTEKATNHLTSYRVKSDGSLGAAIITTSSGQTPFALAFNRRNRLLVTEAVGGAAGASTVSSYRFNASDPARPVIASASVPDTQSAACWVVITPNGRYAYVTNTGSSSVSSYRVANSGQIELVSAVAGQTGAGSAPADVAISTDGRHLVVRNGRVFTISSFSVDGDGSISAESTLTGLPATAVGIAAN